MCRHNADKQHNTSLLSINDLLLLLLLSLQCTDPRAKEKFQQISIAYTKIISSRSNVESIDSDDDEEDDGQIYEDDVHEMRAFMRMFMDLVGIFNDDQVVPDDGKMPGKNKTIYYGICCIYFGII
jgi:hypothetical protein